MKKTLLFAIDPHAGETIVSESEKGSRQITAVARIPRSENAALYDAVALLTALTKAPDFDAAVFKAMDKVCQLLYAKQAEGK